MKLLFKQIALVLIICSFLLCFSTPVTATEECCCWSYLMTLYEEYAEYCEIGGVPYHDCGVCFIVHLWGAGDLECKADDECDGPGQVGCGESVIIEFEHWYYEDCTACLCDPPGLPGGYEILAGCDENFCDAIGVDCECE